MFINHFVRYEANPNIKMLVLLGEVSYIALFLVKSVMMDSLKKIKLAVFI